MLMQTPREGGAPEFQGSPRKAKLWCIVTNMSSSFSKYAGVNIGPIYKKDIMKASVMLERDTQ